MASTAKKEVEMDRVMKDVLAPPMFPMSRDELFDSQGLPRLTKLKEHLFREGRLEPQAAYELITRAGALLNDEPNLLQLKYPITGPLLDPARTYGDRTNKTEVIRTPHTSQHSYSPFPIAFLSLTCRSFSVWRLARSVL